MLNKIIIQGRLVDQPEMRHTGSGTAVASFTLACERDYKGQDGNRETDFVPCVAWRNTGEFVSNYFHKGDMIIATGRLQIRKYKDKSGNPRSIAEAVIDSAYFGGSKKQSGADAPTEGYTPGEFAELPEVDESDLPF